MSGNILQSVPEVDFSTPENVQILFNEHIYDSTIIYKNSKAEINFINENDLLNGAYASVNSKKYKILYNDMVFEGDKDSLSDSSLPVVIYDFFSSFENGIILDSYDKERDCYYTKKIINNYFIVFESYEKEDATPIYSIEIK